MKSDWRGKAYSFIRHEGCEWFPCHQTEDPENFNCLFCYCPMYALDDKCGGRFKYTKQGLKDCSACTFPHEKENFGSVIGRFDEIAGLMKENREKRTKRNE